MGYAALSLLRAQSLKLNETTGEMATSPVDSVLKGVTSKLGQITGWTATETYGRGSYAVSSSNQTAWSATPSAIPGGSITWASSSQVHLRTAVGELNSRAEIRDSGHHMAPAGAQLRIINSSFTIAGIVSIVATNPDTLCTFGLLRGHAGGWVDMENAILFTNMSNTGPQANWQCVIKPNAASQQKVVATGYSVTTPAELRIIWNQPLRTATFIIDGEVVATEVGGGALPKSPIQGFLGAAIREPEGTHTGDSAAVPVISSDFRVTHTMTQLSIRPGYWASPIQQYFNPW